MDQSIKAASGFEEIDTGVMYSSFIAIIEDALVTATPGKKKQKKVPKVRKESPSSPWWNEECEKLIRLRKADLMKFKNTGKYEHFIEYKKRVNIMRRELRRIKKESFQSFCAKLRKNVNPAYVWNTVKKFQAR